MTPPPPANRPAPRAPPANHLHRGTDGKEFPVTGAANYDTEAVRQIDSTTTEMTRKKAGKVVETGTTVMSNGFTVATMTVKGTDAKGKKYARVEVYEERQ